MPSDLIALVAALTLARLPDAVFPDILLGQWTDDLANCGQEDTNGLEITADSVRLYEAVGRLRTVGAAADGAITARLDYRGEGETWSETNRFRVSPDGSTIHVEALDQSFDLRRCPAVRGA